MDGKYNFTFNFLTILSSYHCKYSTKIINRMAWAFYCTHSTAQAQLLVDHRMIINDADSTCGTRLLTDSAAYTAYFTLFFCSLSFLSVGTFHYNIICALVDMYHLLRTHTCTGSTRNTLFFVHLSNTIFIYKNSIKFTFFHAGSATNAAVFTGICAFCCPTSTIAGNNCCPVWKFFLFCHTNASFHREFH